MNRKQIIALFLRNEFAHAKASSLSIQGKRLFSYNTCIAEWFNGELIINRTKYSVTTTRQQNVLAREAHSTLSESVVITEISGNVKIGAQNLMPLDARPIWNV